LTNADPGKPKRDATSVPQLSVGPCIPSGECRFADWSQQVVADGSDKHIVLVLEPGKLGLQVAYSLLQAAHLCDHAGIRTTDVAE
jgi:hypothetical protein